jgi:predicted nucleic acid-binding protein
MPTRYVLDAHAWVEYLRGSPPGKRVKEYIEKGDIHTCSISLAHVLAHAAKQSQDQNTAARAIQTMSRIVPVDSELAIKAAKRYARMAEKSWERAHVLETAKKLGAEIVSGDKEFSSGRVISV